MGDMGFRLGTRGSEFSFWATCRAMMVATLTYYNNDEDDQQTRSDCGLPGFCVSYMIIEPVGAQ